MEVLKVVYLREFASNMGIHNYYKLRKNVLIRNIVEKASNIHIVKLFEKIGIQVDTDDETTLRNILLNKPNTIANKSAHTTKSKLQIQCYNKTNSTIRKLIRRFIGTECKRNICNSVSDALLYINKVIHHIDNIYIAYNSRDELVAFAIVRNTSFTSSKYQERYIEFSCGSRHIELLKYIIEDSTNLGFDSISISILDNIILCYSRLGFKVSSHQNRHRKKYITNLHQIIENERNISSSMMITLFSYFQNRKRLEYDFLDIDAYGYQMTLVL